MDRRDFLGAGMALAALSPVSAKAATQAQPGQIASYPQIASRDGTCLAVREWGRGRPMLFVHSWALSGAMWDYQFAHLGAAGLRCIAFDRRGHGRSDVPPTGYDMASLADDVAAVIEALDLRDLILVGHSMGCAEILRYVGRHGTGRIGRIALLSPTTPFVLRTPDNPGGAPEAMLEGMRASWLSDFPAWIEANKAPFFRPDTSPAMADWLVGLMLATPVTVAAACHKAFTEFDFRPDLARVDVPTVVIHGDKDVSAYLDLTGRPTAQGINGAELRIYEGAPHGLFVTDMDRLNADLTAFAKG